MTAYLSHCNKHTKHKCVENVHIYILFLLANFLVFSFSSTNAQEEQMPLNHAIYSSNAIRSLMTDITKAGLRLVAVGERGHILFSDDNGYNWIQSKVPTTVNLTAVTFINGNVGWAVGHDAVILQTQDGGNTWSIQYSNPQLEIPWLNIIFHNEEEGIVIGAYGNIMHTEDGGKTWLESKASINNPDELHFYDIAAYGNNELIMVGEYGAIFQSFDRGLHWEQLPSPYQGSFFKVLTIPEKNTIIILGLRGHIFRSTDNGASWIKVHSHISTGLLGGTVIQDGTVIIIGNSGNILKSYDAGGSFILRTREDRLSLSGAVVTQNDNLVLVGQGGIHLASLAGNHLPQVPQQVSINKFKDNTNH